ncbi:MAG: class SAM-dependent methyltransferase [Marmoricola sp.]|nr:class SAM-dependent methyltransferase [Marmoricola sp.]
MTESMVQPPSPSMAQPDYWWYRARSELLRTIVEPFIGDPATVLDVGSADGPSVGWMRQRGHRVALDLDFEALGPGDVCASALDMPFADGSFDLVAAFDVLEHCEPESRAVEEIARVLRPGGRLLIAVPAYQWAWTTFDRDIGHHRRYTRKRLVGALEAAGLEVQRSTYMFAGTLPMFTAERLARKMRKEPTGPDTGLPQISPVAERILLGLCNVDGRILRKRNLPFGSSVVAVATRPA